jgi:hypothetical protein
MLGRFPSYEAAHVSVGDALTEDGCGFGGQLAVPDSTFQPCKFAPTAFIRDTARTYIPVDSEDVLQAIPRRSAAAGVWLVSTQPGAYQFKPGCQRIRVLNPIAEWIAISAGRAPKQTDLLYH